MAIFNSYVSLPEGTLLQAQSWVVIFWQKWENRLAEFWGIFQGQPWHKLGMVQLANTHGTIFQGTNIHLRAVLMFIHRPHEEGILFNPHPNFEIWNGMQKSRPISTSYIAMWWFPKIGVPPVLIHVFFIFPYKTIHLWVPPFMELPISTIW